ncbi:MAG TPA: gliding motility protein GldN [Chitinophagales bacterium]|nr:gliding motility protein GldN [Chitinophagales bacterium]HRB19487.1 gliding motility protein GldN [Chitinophagales bacterium]HRB66214.1 gliding motility protein GldN [Chitinophagales bacterium]
MQINKFHTVVLSTLMSLSLSTYAQDSTVTGSTPTTVDPISSTSTTTPAFSGTTPAATTTTTATAVDPTTMKTEVQKLPWVQEITGKRIAMDYEPIREADVFWWKNVWRVIDLREKINLHFKWPKAPFIQVLIDAIESGKVQVYSGMDDDFAAPIDPKEALSVAGGGVDSVWITDPGTGLQTLQVITKEVNWNNVNKLRLKEVWYFNKQTSTMQVRIMGVCPLYDNYDPTTGDFRGEVPTFWVYFPSLRGTLVNTVAFNPFPNGIRLNWDQVFAQRIFGSYIFKVDNVQDFRIKDYKSGIDVLYESEAQKQNLFNFEHDLWEY